MKKLLALVLALVMTLGLATVGTNAAYSDEKDINYKEAVDVLSAVGILKGDENGFRPGETLKRSEGAKIIAYLLAGNESAEAMVGSNKFSDVPSSHWAAGYIDYLASDNVKVISGVGNGKFDPDGTLTTNQFTKMLLVALGFDASIEGLTGPDWAINTQRLANLASVDLFSGNDSAKGNEAIKREEAALYTFNTLCTPLVTYDSKGTEISVNGANINFGSSQWKYDVEQGGNSRYSDNIYTDEVQLAAGAAGTYDLIEFAEKYYTNLRLIGNGNGVDDLGRPMRKWTWYNEEIGTYAAADQLVKTWTSKVTAKMVYDEIGKTVNDSLRKAVWDNTVENDSLKGTELRVYMDGMNFGGVGCAPYDKDNNPTSLLYASNGDDVAIGEPDPHPAPAGAVAVTDAMIDPYVHKTNTTKINGTGNGSVTELYMDKDHNVTLVTYHTYLFQAAGDYSASTKTLNIVQGDDVVTVPLKSYKLKVDDFPQIADYKDDDYLLVTVARTANNQYDVQTVDKAEIVSGKVTTYDTKDNQSVTLDGTLYKYSEKVTDDLKNTMFSVGQTAKLVLDKYGYVIAVDEALETSDYVFVLEWGKTSSTINGDVHAKVVFADGTDGEINVKQAYDYDSETNLAKGAKGTHKGDDETNKKTILGWDKTNTAGDYGTGTNELKWYTFSKSASGEYSLYDIESKYTQDSIVYTAAAGMADATVAENNKAMFLVANPAGVVTPIPESTAGVRTKLLADDKTIAVSMDNREDISVYTGVKNMPEISLKRSADVTPDHVNAYAVHKDNGYSTLVFFWAKGSGTNVTGGEGENLIYVLKFQTKTNAADNKVWYTYKVLDGTEETTVQADNQIATGKYYGAAFYATKNSEGQLTDFKAVTAANLNNTDHKGTVFGAKPSNDAGIKYSGSTFSVGGHSFTVTNNTKTTIVTLGKDTTNGWDASVMNADADASYEVFAGQGSAGARQVASLLENYTYTYDYAVKTTGKDTLIADQIFVTVKTAKLSVAGNGAALKTLVDAAATRFASTAVTQNVNWSIAGGQASNDLVIGANETIDVPAGVTLTVAGDLTIRGTLTLNGTAAATGVAGLVVRGTIYNYSNHSLVLGKNATLNAKTLVNSGKLETADDATTTITVDNLNLADGTAVLYGAVKADNIAVTGGSADFETTPTAKDGTSVKTLTLTGGAVNIAANENLGADKNNVDTTKITSGDTGGTIAGVAPSAYTIAADTALIKIAIV